MSNAAFTLVELLIVIALSALLLALFFGNGSAPSAVRSAQELARIVRHARWSAVSSGQPVMLLTPDHGRSILLVRGPGWSCDPYDAQSKEVVWESPVRGIAVSWPLRGVAFAPDGFPRSCFGDGVGSATAIVGDRATSAAIVVSSLGRVRWELRP